MIKKLITAIGEKHVYIKPSSVTEHLTSESEDLRQEGVNEMSALMSSLVKYYNTELFPLVRDTITAVSDRTKDEMASSYKFKSELQYVYVDPVVVEALRDVVVSAQTPQFNLYHVTLGTVDISNSNTMTSVLNKITLNRAEELTGVLNSIISKENNLNDIILGKYGRTTLSELVAVVNNMSLDNPPAGTMGDNSDYKRMVTALKHLLNHATINLITKINNFVDKGEIIFFRDKDTCVLIDALVQDYYAKGGMIEVLYGLELSTNTRMTTEVLLENQTKFKSTYEVNEMKLLPVRKSMVKGIYGREYKYVFALLINAGKLDTALGSTISKYIDTLSESELIDIKSVVTKIVGTITHPNTGFTRFTQSMEFYSTDNTPNESAGLAALDLIIDLIAEHVTIR